MERKRRGGRPMRVSARLTLLIMASVLPVVVAALGVAYLGRAARREDGARDAIRQAMLVQRQADWMAREVSRTASDAAASRPGVADCADPLQRVQRRFAM